MTVKERFSSKTETKYQMKKPGLDEEREQEVKP